LVLLRALVYFWNWVVGQLNKAAIWIKNFLDALSVLKNFEVMEMKKKVAMEMATAHGFVRCDRGIARFFIQIMLGVIVGIGVAVPIVNEILNNTVLPGIAGTLAGYIITLIVVVIVVMIISAIKM